MLINMKGEWNWKLKILLLNNTEFQNSLKKHPKQWHSCPFNRTMPQSFQPIKDSNPEQCFHRSTNHSTEVNAVVPLTEREILLRKISTYQFAALDLQLFLDTHPNDKKILEKMKEYRDKSLPLIKEYEEKYGPLTKNMTSTNNWRWIKGPWPWESEADS